MKNKYVILAALLGCLLISPSCNDFLDELPDQRTEIDTDDKLAQLMVSAYPNVLFQMLSEMSSDNVTDNGSHLNYDYTRLLQAYFWQDIAGTGSDTPHGLWQEFYMAIATCNTALRYIEESGNPARLASYKAEALICRAYCHFVLVNIFCQHYNEQSSSTDMGIPYMETVENELKADYDRGTVKEVYEKIDRDIEAALPHLDDSRYKVPGYRFNTRAAHAFAARFNLYYRKDLQKVVDYATVAVGSNPTSSLRNYHTYDIYAEWSDISSAYTNPEDKWNLLVQAGMSTWARTVGPYVVCRRYTHSPTLCNKETYYSNGIWNVLEYVYFNIDGNYANRANYPKLKEYFVFTNPTAQTGYPHNVVTLFTTDEALLCRAEAYTYLGQYDKAMADLTQWNLSHQTPANEATVTTSKINALYGSRVMYGPTKKELNPRFDLEKGGFQEALIHCILHVRRVETIADGLRWFDIKRYGIAVSHERAGELPLELSPYDNRCALQLPEAVISSGMAPNPR